MLKVNLSRLDNMIRVQQQEKQETLTRINSLPFSVHVRIYEKTDNRDMEKVAEKAGKLRQRFLALAQKLDRHDEYIAYLRHERERANIRCGINERLQQKAALEERIVGLRNLYQIARSNTPYSSVDNLEVTELKGADFYKSSFTDTCKTCDLAVAALLQEDLEKFSLTLQELQSRLRECLDELATMNQETYVQIREFDEAVRV